MTYTLNPIYIRHFWLVLDILHFRFTLHFGTFPTDIEDCLYIFYKNAHYLWSDQKLKAVKQLRSTMLTHLFCFVYVFPFSNECTLVTNNTKWQYDCQILTQMKLEKIETWSKGPNASRQANWTSPRSPAWRLSWAWTHRSLKKKINNEKKNGKQQQRVIMQLKNLETVPSTYLTSYGHFLFWPKVLLWIINDVLKSLFFV